jgi:four helix bundle protein
LAQSKPEFVSKVSIVLEEVDEACFWLEFVIEQKLLSEKRIGNLLKEGKELTAVFITSRKTVKNRKEEFLAEVKNIK